MNNKEFATRFHELQKKLFADWDTIDAKIEEARKEVQAISEANAVVVDCGESHFARWKEANKQWTALLAEKGVAYRKAAVEFDEACDALSKES